MLRYSIALFISTLLLTGCASSSSDEGWWKPSERPAPRSRSQGSFKVGKPYHIGGKMYTPTESYSYDETGISSWYGDEFHGKRTANGEIFDKNALTAAHPSLQLPALIRVTNLQNGRSAVLRVNDRGPFSKSRLIDVSHKAANVLGYEGAGTARVRVQVLDKESRILADAARQGYPPHIQMAMAFRRAPETAAATTEVVQNTQQTVEVASNDIATVNTVATTTVATTELPSPQTATKADVEELNKELFRKYPVTPTSIYIQVCSFSNAANAESLRPKLSSIGPVLVSPTTVNGQAFNRVRIGPISNVPAADAMLKKTIAAGFPAARIIVD